MKFLERHAGMRFLERHAGLDPASNFGRVLDPGLRRDDVITSPNRDIVITPSSRESMLHRQAGVTMLHRDAGMTMLHRQARRRYHTITSASKAGA
jgi:hypothetical protein